MAEATNAQMQAYADGRLRVRAEAFRGLRAACLDDKSAIDDIYARAAGTNRWNDTRTDPPHILQAGNSASPDDMLNYNALVSLFEKFCAGTFSDLGEANSAAGSLATLERACVRPV